MAYIGVTVQNQLNPAFLKEDFVGTGSATQFTLTNEVLKFGNEDNVMVVVSNIVQRTNHSIYD